MRHQPAHYPGMIPIGPPRQSTKSAVIATAIREVLIFAGLFLIAAALGVLDSPLMLFGYILARGLIHVLAGARRDRQLFRTLSLCVLAGALAAIVATATPDLPALEGRQPKPPVVKVDAAQVDQLAKAKDIWAKAWAQVATAFSTDPEEAAK
jgi:hypothetical protein